MDLLVDVPMAIPLMALDFKSFACDRMKGALTELNRLKYRTPTSYNKLRLLK